MNRLGGLGVAMAAAVAWGCAAITGGDPACPVEPVPVAELAAGLPLRAQIRFLDDGDGQAVEAVAALEAGELVVVGLAPFGARLFSIRQHERAVHVESTKWSRVGPPPDWVLDVLHRVFWIQPPTSARAGEAVAWQRGAEEVRDLFGDTGRRRSFSRGPDYAEDVVIEYPAASERGREQAVTIHNPWCGYSGRVVALGSDGPGAPPREAR